MSSSVGVCNAYEKVLWTHGSCRKETGLYKAGIEYLCYSWLLCLRHSHLNTHAWTSPLVRTPGLLIIQKFVMASKTLRIQQAFSYLFKYRCYLYNIFQKIWFSREQVSTEGKALELLFFHLCSIATVIRTPTLSQRFLKVQLKIIMHWSWGGSFGAMFPSHVHSSPGGLLCGRHRSAT